MNFSQYARFITVAIGLVFLLAGVGQASANFRPPSVPLVTSNPYFSIWSPSDKLTDSTTQHWTGRKHPLVSLIRIDGATYRLMGTDPAGVPAFPQTSLTVLPTRSIYDFDNGHVHVTLTFMTPLLPDDIGVLSRPLSYITWAVRSVDGLHHAISLYDSTSTLLTVSSPSQKVVWSRESTGDLTALKAGSDAQTFFTPMGDNVAINWGYVYAAAQSAQSHSAIGDNQTLLQSFAANGALPVSDDTRQPRAASDDQPVLAFSFDLGSVGGSTVSRHVMLAYDEVYSMLWFDHKLRPYWRRNGAKPEHLLQDAERDYPELTRRCADFDHRLMADLDTEGGPKYAQIAALAYRQCWAACGLAADTHNEPLLLTKENTSGGDISTVDVIFPMAPLQIFLCPSLAKACLAPVLAYSESGHWKFPNAPHDIGTYPIADGRDWGGEAMPVEESANMIILCDAVEQAEGNPDFVAPYWNKLTQWAQFLEQFGIDTGNQGCTDDFMAPLAHSSNLSVKAILGLAAYGDLCKMRGDSAGYARYAALAKADGRHWMDVNDTGSHSQLALDQPNTWSQKYNLVWDRILGLNVFPPEVARKEIAYYKTVMQPLGLPLDLRTHTTKTDWSTWSATLADNKADFETLISPMYAYFNTTPTRIPLADSYQTDYVNTTGMHARPVIGGVFIKMLSDRAMWMKWASMDKAQFSGWAPVPNPPSLTNLVPASDRTRQTWSYTTVQPADNWTTPNFDDLTWQQGPGGFGSKDAGFLPIGTAWTGSDIWLRRVATLPPGPYINPEFSIYHYDDAEVYINGVPAAQIEGNYWWYQQFPPTTAGLALLKPGSKITLAVHCHRNGGISAIDVGLVDVVPVP